MNKLSTHNAMIFFTALFLAVLCITGLWVKDAYDNFETRIHEFKTEYIKDKKNILKREVRRVVNHINYIRRTYKYKTKLQLQEAQKEALGSIRQIKYCKDGYIFIIAENGNCILNPAEPSLEGKNILNYKDVNGKYLIKELISAAKNPKHPFVKYIWKQPSTGALGEKMSYAEYVPIWGWVVGSGAYINNMNSEIREKKLEFKKDLNRKLLEILAIFIIILTFASFLLYKQTAKINQSFKLFHNFLKNAHKRRDEIDLNNIDFEEFYNLAQDANMMIRKKIKIQKELSEKNFILNETINNLQTVLDSTIEMIVFSKNGKLIDVNQAALDTIGFKSKEEVIGKNMLDFLPKNEIEKGKEALVLNDKTARELTIYKKDGTFLKVLAKGKNITQNGEIVRMSTFVDLSEIKQRDEAIAASKAKSEFLANMSHEIRTPLNAILGFIDLLKDENLDKKSMEYIEIIDNSSRVLLQVIEDILDFSKIESGKLNIDKIDFNLKDELGVISHLYQAKCSQKDINLEVIFKDSLPLTINTDPLRVKQIISNLLSNAIKFTKPHKNITVTFDFKENNLLVSVKDEGKGIAKDKLKSIFDPFTQEDNSTTRKFGGTGLGLAISSQLAKLLGGELKVKSELGIGSEFYFYIPVTVVSDSNKTLEKSQNTTFKNKKVLLAEDNKANQLFMKVLLKKMDLMFDVAQDGIEAVEMYKKNRYNIILMDENMPNLNGIEATRQILEYEKLNNLEHTPIVALTANALKGDREKFLDAGMDEYLTKPLKREKLEIILRKFLQKRDTK